MNENVRLNEYRYCSWCKKNVDSKEFGSYQVCEPCRAKMKKKKVKTLVQEAAPAVVAPAPVVPVAAPAPVVSVVAAAPVPEIKAAPIPKSAVPKAPTPMQSRLKQIIEHPEQQEESDPDDGDNEEDEEEEEMDLSIEPPQKPPLRRQNAYVYERQPEPKRQAEPQQQKQKPNKDEPVTHISIFG